MKRNWDTHELEEHFTLSTDELQTTHANKTEATRLGFAILLKTFEYQGRFPQTRAEIPAPIIAFLAHQLDVAATTLSDYAWEGRTFERHRALIRQRLGFREATAADAEALTQWTTQQAIAAGLPSFETLREALFSRSRAQHIEPPAPVRLERLIRSAMRTAEEQLFEQFAGQLSTRTCDGLDALLLTEVAADAQGQYQHSAWSDLGADLGAPALATVLLGVERLQRIQSLEMPQNLFAGMPATTITQMRHRAAVEEPYELRRHPAPTRYALMAAFCFLRAQEITDDLADLICDVVHRIGARAEKRVERTLFKDFKRVPGKNRLLARVAQASLAKPDGRVCDVIFPVAPEETLSDVLKEYLASGSYERQVQTVMRGSYTHHYRRMLAPLLQALRFGASNPQMVLALDLLKRYADSEAHNYAPGEVVPLEGIVPAEWRELVVSQTRRGQIRVNRIAYEMCVLSAAREGLRCRSVWLAGARRYRNPDEDLPADFAAHRQEHCARLGLPSSADEFIAQEKKALTQALADLNRTIRKNLLVTLQTKNGKGRISVTPLPAQAEPMNWARLKGDVRRHWNATSLLDMLKETDLRTQFTQAFHSATAVEKLDRRTLQRRLLLCLYGLGTNAGLGRVAAGDHGESYRDLLYVRRRYLSKDGLREATVQVVNAIFRARNPG